MVLEWASKNRYSDEVMVNRLREYDLVMNRKKNYVISRLRSTSFGADILLAAMWLADKGYGDNTLKELGRVDPIDINNEDYSLAFKKQY